MFLLPLFQVCPWIYSNDIFIPSDLQMIVNLTLMAGLFLRIVFPNNSQNHIRRDKRVRLNEVVDMGAGINGKLFMQIFVL